MKSVLFRSSVIGMFVLFNALMYASPVFADLSITSVGITPDPILEGDDIDVQVDLTITDTGRDDWGSTSMHIKVSGADDSTYAQIYCGVGTPGIADASVPSNESEDFVGLTLSETVGDYTLQVRAYPNPAGVDCGALPGAAGDTFEIDFEIIRISNLETTKTSSSDDNGGQVAPGTEMTYTITVKNNGPSDADNVKVTDTLPQYTTYVSDDDSCAENAGEYTCNLGTVTNGNSAELNIVVMVDEDAPLGTTITNTAAASSDSESGDAGEEEDDVDSSVVVAVGDEGTALIAVQKFFTDGNDETPVTLTLECTSGTYAPASVPVNPDDFEPGSAFEHIFVIDLIPEGPPNPCTVVEEPVAGYEATYICGQAGSTSTVDDTLCNSFADFSDGSTACGWLDVQAGDVNLCGIFNSPAPVDVDVHKVWEMAGNAQADVNQDVRITLICDGEIVGGTEAGNLWWTQQDLTIDGGDFDDEEGDYTGMGTATFEVIPDFYSTAADPEKQDYTTCYTKESMKDSYVELDNGCGDSLSEGTIMVSAGMGDECTMTNTVFFEGIPTLNQYGMAIMALLMLGVGFVGFRRFV